jgi:hypothetical protein
VILVLRVWFLFGNIIDPSLSFSSSSSSSSSFSNFYNDGNLKIKIEEFPDPRFG